MSDETAIAFAPLAQRAAAEVDATNPPDRISVRDHVVEVEIGAFQSERDTTQRVRFSVVVEVAPSDGAATDDVDDILSYDTITDAIEAELAAERLNLLETLAERIADRILREPQPLRVFVRIEKLDRGSGTLGVEIVRHRAVADTATDQADEVKHPMVVLLDRAAVNSPDLGGFLDRLEQGARPAILCVEGAEPPTATTPLSGPAARIDLLSTEQMAWRLAARDARCVVVETRTELDWGMNNGQISVWAPSKLVLDAVEGPASAAPLELAVWFAAHMQAEMLIVIGHDAPALSPIPVMSRQLVDAP
ncbi:dihydroneopterin aldolase [Aliiroseovarius sp. CAU 1755]